MPEIQQPWLVSLLPPSLTLRRAALAVSTFLLVAFVITIAFAEVMLPRLNIYIPLVATVMFLNDVITASLLLVQFSIARSRTLLVLANGYLFTALVAAVYGLFWPGAFHPTGLFGAGPETPPWLYLVWHAGLPTSVIVYALLKSKEYETPPVTRDSVPTFIFASITCNILIVCGLTWFVTRFHDVLPILVTSVDRASAFSTFGTGGILIVSIGALVLQWRGRRRSVLDLSLSVVTLAWLLGSIMLTAIGARYDVAWYATPGFLVVSAIPVLLVLLSESLMLHAQFDLNLLLENKRAEEQLRRSRAYLAEAQKVSHTGSWAWNNAREIVYWSEECFRIHGRDPAQGPPSLEQVLADIDPAEVPGIAASLEKAMREGRGWELEYRMINFADGPRTVRTIAHPVLDASGRVEYIGTVADITEQKRAEQELRTSELERARAEQALRDAREKLAQASKIASLAELSASIAHEINQPLQAIVANGHASLRWLDATPPNIEKAIRTAKRVVRDGNAAAEVVSRIRALFEHAVPAKVDLDINKLILQVGTLMADEIQGNAVSLETGLGEDVPTIRADAVQIQQVIVNLVRNAIEAMAATMERPLLVRSRRSGGHVVVDVRDQ